MTPARPLHELLTDLVGDAGPAQGDPQEYLSANGHPDLPPELVAEAVVSYADTAPVEVAEQLAPYVTAHSAVPAGEEQSADWFDLLTTAPTGELEADPGLDDLSSSDSEGPDPDTDADPGPEFDFGTGSADLLDEPLESTAPVEPATSTGSSTSDDSAAEVADDDESRAWTDLEPADPALDTDDSDDSDVPDIL
jgi:hypothetical protein